MRIRTIKPEFFTHEGIYEAERESGLPLRIAFIGLWCAADREGRFRWEPRRLGVQILPYEKVDFSRVLDALTTRGFIARYETDHGDCGIIPSFLRHQIINNRERESDLPNPLDCKEYDASSTRDPREGHACKGEGKGREQGREGNKERREVAKRVLARLNEKAKRAYRPVDGNLDLIVRRLSEPEVDEDGVNLMVDRMCEFWSGDRMSEYLRPATLFGKEKFDGYYASRFAPIPQNGNHSETPKDFFSA